MLVHQIEFVQRQKQGHQDARTNNYRDIEILINQEYRKGLKIYKRSKTSTIKNNKMKKRGVKI